MPCDPPKLRSMQRSGAGESTETLDRKESLEGPQNRTIEQHKMPGDFPQKRQLCGEQREEGG